MSAFDGALLGGVWSKLQPLGVCSSAALALNTSSTGSRGSWYWVAGGFRPTSVSQSIWLSRGWAVGRFPSPPSKQLGETMSAAGTTHDGTACARPVPSASSSTDVASTSVSSWNRRLSDRYEMALADMIRLPCEARPPRPHDSSEYVVCQQLPRGLRGQQPT